VEDLEGVSPAALWRAARDPVHSDAVANLPSSPIRVEPGREQVHLRFLVGAGVTSQEIPAVLRQAADVGRWGMAVTRELARQLAQPGLDVLPMPRAPQSLVSAAYVGRCAQLEAALSLFLGNVVRQIRTAAGEPQAVLSAHRLDGGAGELRLSLSSPLDDALLEGYTWPLHPLDTIAGTVTIFEQLLADCRIADVRHVNHVLPDVLAQDMRFMHVRQVSRSASH
jgi:hypothetical protein